MTEDRDHKILTAFKKLASKKIEIVRWRQLKSETDLTDGSLSRGLTNLQKYGSISVAKISGRNAYALKEFEDKLKEKSQRSYKKKILISQPKINMNVTQTIHGSKQKRFLPSVGFNLFNPNSFPVKVKLKTSVILGGRNLGFVKDKKGYYFGKRIINLNVGGGLGNGNFSIPQECVTSREELTIEIQSVVIDQFDNEYQRLPQSWTYMRDTNNWYYEPSGFT
jgi:hypothetical protein